VCEPLTLYTPPLPLTTPTDLPPSPQSIETVKSDNGASGFASVKLATSPLNDDPSCELTVAVTPLAVNGASATVAVAVSEPVLPGWSVSLAVTLTV